MDEVRFNVGDEIEVKISFKTSTLDMGLIVQFGIERNIWYHAIIDKITDSEGIFFNIPKYFLKGIRQNNCFLLNGKDWVIRDVEYE